MNNKFVALIAVAVVVIGGWTVFKDSGMEDGLAPLNPGAAAGGGAIEEEMAGIKDFVVKGEGFAFDLKNIVVNEGDTVRITFMNEGGFHDLVIDEFNVRTQKLPAGQSESIVFVADKKGTFEYYCSVGTHRQQGMVGTITVN